MTQTVKVNEEFKALLDPLMAEERQELERQLIRDGGARDPIIIWKDHGDIVDGHNRYDICIANDLKFKTTEMAFEDAEAVKMWMMENQLGRRNLNPARATYYRGTLYNMLKQKDMAREPSPDGKSTSETLAARFGVSEHTIRRDGDIAKGIDTVAKVRNIDNVREKLAQIAGRSETSLTKQELGAIGTIKEPDVAAAAVANVDTAKAQGMVGPSVVKAAIKVAREAKGNAAPEKEKPAKKELYPVAFAAPAFDMSLAATTAVRPPLSDNAVLYMSVPDEELVAGLDLMKKWGLKYECSFIFPVHRYEGLWSNITHQFLLVGTKGDVIGPKTPHASLTSTKSDDPEALMVKMIEGFHPQTKRIDLRPKAVASTSWAVLPKAA